MTWRSKDNFLSDELYEQTIKKLHILKYSLSDDDQWRQTAFSPTK